VSCLLIKCCKYFVLCLLYITDTTPWQAICISSTLKYNRRFEKHVIAHFQRTTNTCVKHNFKSVHVSNLFWSREYSSAKEICKYPSFSKVGGNYPLDLKIIWSSAMVEIGVIIHDLRWLEVFSYRHVPFPLED
jgi:hypothetical protein